MPNDTFRTFFGDYMLSCRPLALEDGLFQARVVITSLGGAKTRSQRFIDLDTFSAHDDAVEHARRAGVDWIMRNDPSAPSLDPGSASNPIGRSRV